MYLADTLSRAPLPNATSRDEVLTIDKEVERIQMVDFLPLRKASLDEIRKESLRGSNDASTSESHSKWVARDQE